MKTSILILFFAVSNWTMSVYGQTSEKIENLSVIRGSSPTTENYQPLYSVDDLTSAKEAPSPFEKSEKNGVVIIRTQKANDSTETSKLEKLPFQVYSIKNTGWVIQQDIYNALRARVPSLTISNTNNLGATPALRIRGYDAPIILLDGVRVDASILNTLNPEDIESIHVAPSAAGTNYFLNGYRTN